MTFSDPFGLMICFAASGDSLDRLVDSTEAATGTAFALDDNNCATNVQPKGGHWNTISHAFSVLASDKQHVAWLFYGPGSSETLGEWGIRIDLNDIGRPYATHRNWLNECKPSKGSIYTSEVPIIGHELGHLLGRWGGVGPGLETWAAMGWENAIHAQRAGEPARDPECHQAIDE